MKNKPLVIALYVAAIFILFLNLYNRYQGQDYDLFYWMGLLLFALALMLQNKKPKSKSS